MQPISGGSRLAGNRRYPGTVGDYRTSFARLGRMRPDIVLPAHPEQDDVTARGRRAAAGEAGAFVAPALMPALEAVARNASTIALAEQQAAAKQACVRWSRPCGSACRDRHQRLARERFP